MATCQLVDYGVLYLKMSCCIGELLLFQISQCHKNADKPISVAFSMWACPASGSVLILTCINQGLLHLCCSICLLACVINVSGFDLTSHNV